jgi:beta-lactamase regulating signal transducer with metallopeptidase domain
MKMQTLIRLMSSAAADCCPALAVGIALLLRTALPLAAALAAVYALRNRDPRARAGICSLALAATAGLCALSLTPAGRGAAALNVALQTTSPAVRAIGPEPSIVTEAPAALRSTGATTPRLPASTIAADGAVRETDRRVSGSISASRGSLMARPATAYGAALLVWIGGAVLSLLWIAAGQLRLAALRRRAVPCCAADLCEHLDRLCARQRVRRPSLLVSDEIAGPLVMGIARPGILLPSELMSRTDAPTVQAILAHELQHVANADIAWTFGARLLCALLWPQPLLWLVARARREAAEEACDAAALEQECSPQRYARCLVSIA